MTAPAAPARITSAPRIPIAVSLVALAGTGIANAARLPGFPVEFLYAFLVSGTLRAVFGRDLGRLAPRAVLQGLGTVLAVVAVFWLVQRAQGGGPSVVVGTLAVCAAMEALFILGSLEDRNGVYPIVLLSTLQVVATSWLKKDPGSLGLAVLYTAVLLWTLMLVERHLRAERPAPRSQNTRRVRFSARHPLPTLVALRTFVVLILIGFPIGLVVYFVVPRVDAAKPSYDFDRAGTEGTDRERDLFEGRRMAREFLTGPSSETQYVEFGSVGKIKESHLPVLEVSRRDGRRPRGVYLRDNVLDQYDPSGAWRSSPSLVADGKRVLQPDADGWFPLEPDAGVVPEWIGEAEVLHIETLKTGFGRWYLMPWPLRARLMRGPVGEKSPVTRARIHKLGSHTLTLRFPGFTEHQFQQYDRIEVEYVSQRRLDRDLTGHRSDLAVSPLSTYLDLPQATRSAAGPIARRVVRGVDDPWTRARRLEEWLKSEEFEYTLAVPVLDEQEKVVDFLQNVKRGHCEIYASALVVLLRSLGHPARYARGFWGGDPTGVAESDRGSIYMRLSHYHAWTEMYLDGVGWVALNPTPPDRTASDATRDEHALGDGVDETGQPVDAPEGGTPDAPFLEFGRDEYDAFWRGVGDTIVDGVQTAARFLFSGKSGYLGVVLFVLAVATMLFVRQRQAVRAVATSAGSAIPAGPYGRGLLVLARKGIRRPASQTPRELVDWVARILPAAATPLATLTTLFERERYGGEAGAGSGRDARNALSALSDAVRHGASPDS